MTVFGSAAASPAWAQRPTDTTARLVFEGVISERWLHGRESAEFKLPTESRNRWIFVDSVTRYGVRGDGRALHMRMRSGSGEAATLVLDGQGRVLSSLVAPRDVSGRSLRTAEDTARVRRQQLFELGGNDGFSIPANRIAELSPAFRPAGLRAGAIWLDTIDIAASVGSYFQRLSGVRWHRLERDTVVGGARYWIVRDSANVDYSERWQRRERTLDAMVTIARQGQGLVTGRYLYDAELALPIEWHDTTRIEGSAVLEYPDGRSFTTPARFERNRFTRVLDSSGYEERLAEMRRARRAEYGGIVSYPRNALEERLAAGDVLLQDSLVEVWSATRGTERAELARVLARWPLTDPPALAERMNRMALEAGDTASYVRRKLRDVRWAFRIEPEVLDLLLPYLEDPGLAFSRGLELDPMYEGLQDRLVGAPPAITADTAAWACAPLLCERLAALADPVEWRLSDLGLLARFLLDPAPWAEDIRAVARSYEGRLGSALRFLDGVGATWEAATRAPLPGAGAGWRAWADWMNGRDPAYQRAGEPPPNPVRFNSRHRQAIQFQELLTGRDIAEELRSELVRAEADSARWVYSGLLLAMDEYVPDEPSIVAHLTGGSDALAKLGQLELDELMVSAAPAGPELRDELHADMLSILVDGSAPWPYHPSLAEEVRYGPERVSNGVPIYLLTVGLSESLSGAVDDRLTPTSREEWSSMPTRQPGLLIELGEVTTTASFARVGATFRVRSARSEDEAPGGYAGGYTVTLLKTDGGWAIVLTGMWIT